MTTSALLEIVTLISFAIVLMILGFWFWMLTDCINKKFKHQRSMIEWFIIIIFLPVVGAIIYYFLVKRKHDLLESKEKNKSKRKSL